MFARPPGENASPKQVTSNHRPTSLRLTQVGRCDSWHSQYYFFRQSMTPIFGACSLIGKIESGRVLEWPEKRTQCEHKTKPRKLRVCGASLSY